MTHTTKTLTTDQFAHALIQKFDLSTQLISPDIAERLRFARARALDAQKLGSVSVASTASAWELQSQSNNAVVLGGGASGLGRFGPFNFDFLGKWSAIIPLLALVLGMWSIGQFQAEQRAKEVAEIDAALLTDDLPPTAYADQGFGQYLKLQQER